MNKGIIAQGQSVDSDSTEGSLGFAVEGVNVTIIEIPRKPVLKALHDWLGEDIREKRKAHIKIGYNIGRAP